MFTSARFPHKKKQLYFWPNFDICAYIWRYTFLLLLIRNILSDWIFPIQMEELCCSTVSAVLFVLFCVIFTFFFGTKKCSKQLFYCAIYLMQWPIFCKNQQCFPAFSGEKFSHWMHAKDQIFYLIQVFSRGPYMVVSY